MQDIPVLFRKTLPQDILVLFRKTLPQDIPILFRTTGYAGCPRNRNL